ncbi:MAG: SGNH/GDSL hydrolase family protein [Clostridia bacterium]|nr:SGNH/GDSL hydrolase family protein [Clostridia bacterium]
MMSIKILFQGDSITDAGRDKRNYHHLGGGYPKYAAELIAENHKDIDFEFINFGISGNRTSQLFDRLYPDAIAFQPDVISILIGINDIWHRYGANKISTNDEQIETNYRAILTSLKKNTNAKIMMLSPYLLDCDDKEAMRDDLKRVLEIVRRLADEFADVYVPLDKHFEEAIKTAPMKLYYSNDGVHPNENGAKFIGKIYAEAIEKIL